MGAPAKPSYRREQEVAAKMQAIAAATRALAGEGELEVIWGSNAPSSALLTNRKAVHLPSLHAATATPEAHTRYVRGVADLSALVLKHHNTAQHRKGRPHAEKAAAIYDALETVRVETFGARHMAGARHNLQARYEEWCDTQGYARVSEYAEPPLADILATLLRERITKVAPPAAMQGLLKAWKLKIEEKAGKALDALTQETASQSAFAEAVYSLLTDLGISEGGRGPVKGDSQAGKSQTSQDDDTNDEEEQREAETESMPTPTPSSEEGDGEKNQQVPVPAMADDFQEATEEESQKTESLPNRERPADTLASDFYAVYMRKYDQVVMADELANAEELVRLRQQLDQKLMQFSGVTSRLASRLQRLLMAKRLRHWEFEQEEGMIDASRLPQVVISPDYPYYYKQERDTDFRDTVVTLLLDNSGSMRGRPITVAALSADILARTLERCGVKVEILGFTTRDWKGGAVRKQWLADGGTAHPGRLNDLRHIIYKSADQRWQKGRRNLGLMLKDGILKENIDGEAILWAHERLIARPEERKILMVISDGAPVDDSTLSVNHGAYLDRHLREVIHFIENRSVVELLAIGIGHDVTRYYSRAVTLTDVNELGDTMVKELTSLFGEVTDN